MQKRKSSIFFLKYNFFKKVGGKLDLPAFLLECAQGKMQDVQCALARKGAGKKNKFCVGSVKIIHSVRFKFSQSLFRHAFW